MIVVSIIVLIAAAVFVAWVNYDLSKGKTEKRDIAR